MKIKRRQLEKWIKRKWQITSTRYNFSIKFWRKKHTNQKEVAYAFNKFFFSFSKNLVTEHPNRYVAIKLLNKLKTDHIVEMKSILVTEIKIMSIIQSFKPKIPQQWTNFLQDSKNLCTYTN